MCILILISKAFTYLYIRKAQMMEGCEPALFEIFYVLVLDCKSALVSREMNKDSRKQKKLYVKVEL